MYIQGRRGISRLDVGSHAITLWPIQRPLYTGSMSSGLVIDTYCIAHMIKPKGPSTGVHIGPPTIDIATPLSSTYLLRRCMDPFPKSRLIQDAYTPANTTGIGTTSLGMDIRAILRMHMGFYMGISPFYRIHVLWAYQLH